MVLLFSTHLFLGFTFLDQEDIVGMAVLIPILSYICQKDGELFIEWRCVKFSDVYLIQFLLPPPPPTLQAEHKRLPLFSP